MSASVTDSSGSGTGSESSDVRRLSIQDQQYIRGMLRQFASNSTADLGKAKANAIADSSDAVDSVMKQYKDQGLPERLGPQRHGFWDAFRGTGRLSALHSAGGRGGGAG